MGDYELFCIISGVLWPDVWINTSYANRNVFHELCAGLNSMEVWLKIHATIESTEVVLISYTTSFTDLFDFFPKNFPWDHRSRNCHSSFDMRFLCQDMTTFIKKIPTLRFCWKYRYLFLFYTHGGTISKSWLMLRTRRHTERCCVETLSKKLQVGKPYISGYISMKNIIRFPDFVWI